MRGFEYVRPSSLEEACRLLGRSEGESRVLAGGTDLLVQVKQKRLHPDLVVSLRDVPGLSFIRVEPDGSVAIGAMTSLGAIETSKEMLEHLPPVAEAASMVGSVQVRSRATLGGNLCNAAPSADMAPILIAYEATVDLGDGRRDRSIPLEDFFTGPGQTVLETGEVMKAVRIPRAPEWSFGTYLKAFRSSMDIAVVGVGIRVTFRRETTVCQDLRLVLGAVAPTPMRARGSERMAAGRELDDVLIEEISRMASEEARPISDVRSTAGYRKSLVTVLTRRVLLAARDWAEKGGRR
ncbi:MAG: xanthine dehydrogenase family protein subunit M [Deltaproteobacteria bacterium]|nr:xanthine dehydrogenase family protein subunit M [Deltaproteobacteria bacterium]